ncbi:DUF362 domain-containing protein [Iocasia frigidifontis]|uniref:DUF362 domain-containing protein n=1 Tax=Iocasia fonsfrigidae TaxID=2682810 RepID=A0A8A7K8Y2_9FIRM|nr:DUF362 domain-containing protein [Iocasia fonsfrigidae]QTL98206.1 DUF362 domain-containing protein [Iocasia fonsfrigidae]
MQKRQLHIKYGNKAKEMVYDLLDKLNIASDIDKRNSLIGIKPNLVLPSPSNKGATTSPDLVEGIIRYLQDNGYNNIVILEGAWVGASTEKAFEVCGYNELSRKYKIPLIDLKKDKYKEIDVEGLSLKVCQKALEIDYLINLPVLKAHCQTHLTCALKNLKGCIPDPEKRRFHRLGLHQPIAFLNKVLESKLVIVDGIIGDLTFEEGGNPVQMDRIIIGQDPVLIDTYCAALIGYSKNDISYIDIANEIGIGSSNLEEAEIIEHNPGYKSDKDFYHSTLVKKLARKVTEDKSCSACYGSLIHALKRLEEKGIKPKEKIFIGQGFKGLSESGIGIGNCTSGFSKNIKGCPPSAKAIIDYIISQQ